MSKPKIYDVIATGTTEPRDIRDRFADVINVKDFGAVGDGIVDDTIAIQKALDTCGYGGTVYFDTGKTYLTSNLISTRANIVELRGSTLKALPRFVSEDILLYMRPVVRMDVSNLSIPVTENQDRIDLPANFSTVETGDMVRLFSNDVSVDGYTYGQYTMVTSTSPTSIGISTPICATYTISRIIVFKRKSGTKISNGIIDISDAPSTVQNTQALSIVGSNIVVDNMIIKGNYHTGILLSTHGENINVTNCHLNTCLNILGMSGVTGRMGYGIAITGNNTTISNCIINDCKHAICGGANRSNMTIGVSLSNVSIYESSIDGIPDSNYGGSIDMHSNTISVIEIRNSRVFSKLRSIQNRSPWLLFSIYNSTFINEGSLFILGSEVDISNMYFYNCTFKSLSTENTSFLFQTTTASTNVKNVDNVFFDNCDLIDCGITGGDVSVNNITFQNSRIDYKGVVFYNSGTSNKNIVLRNNRIRCSQLILIRLQDGSSSGTLECTGNIVQLSVISAAYIVIQSSTTTSTCAFNGLNISNNTLEFDKSINNTGFGIQLNGISIENLMLKDNIIVNYTTNSDAILLKNVSINNGLISGNITSSNIKILTDNGTTVLTNLNIVGNTGGAYSLTKSASGEVLKTKYNFDTMSNSFDTVNDVL